MLYLKHIPGRPLSDFVEYFWLLADAPAHAREHILPTGTLELVINLREDEIVVGDPAGADRRLPGLVVSGAFVRPMVVDTATHALVVGAHFRPGGAFPFLRVPPSELTDVHGDVAALSVPRAGELRERLCAAGSHAERFRILELALLPRAVEASSARHGPLVARAVGRLARGDAAVRAVVAELGVSHRHLASVFRDAVGLTPKVFARIQRFQQALAAVDPRVPPDWAELAVARGYCDQAHLIREFSAFAGCTPREHLRRRSADLKDHHVLAS